jgi:hypothetical protein
MARRKRSRRNRSHDFGPERPLTLDLTVDEIMLDLDPAWSLAAGEILRQQKKSSGSAK